VAQIKEGFNASYAGVGDMLRSEWMEAAMVTRAEKITAHAQANAPVGDPATDPHSGRYKESFAPVESTRRGGIRKDRAEATASNTAPEALIVEKGTSRQEGHHTLMRAAAEAQ